MFTKSGIQCGEISRTQDNIDERLFVCQIGFKLKEHTGSSLHFNKLCPVCLKKNFAVLSNQADLFVRTLFLNEFENLFI